MIFSHKITSVTHEPFSNIHIRKILDSVMSTVLYETNGQAILCDPFARQSFTTHLPNCITNDLNTEFRCDYNLEFKEFAYTIQERGHSIDLLFFDLNSTNLLSISSAVLAGEIPLCLSIKEA